MKRTRYEDTPENYRYRRAVFGPRTGKIPNGIAADLCETCKQGPATEERYGGLEWSPICDDCASWYPADRIRPRRA